MVASSVVPGVVSRIASVVLFLNRFFSCDFRLLHHIFRRIESIQSLGSICCFQQLRLFSKMNSGPRRQKRGGYQTASGGMPSLVRCLMRTFLVRNHVFGVV